MSTVETETGVSGLVYFSSKCGKTLLQSSTVLSQNYTVRLPKVKR